jgi:predicted amidohydrolase
MKGIFNAIGLQTVTYDCKYNLRDKPDYQKNLGHVCRWIDNAILHSLEYPPKLLALCEGAIQGFPDELHDWDPVEYARNGAISIPGPETDRLAEKAAKWNIFLIGQAKAKMKEFPDRFFNTAFIIDPTGKIIHQHRKNVVFTLEHTTTPHDLYDEWVEMFGEGLDAFFPVARTEVGNIGACICMEGNFPETARGLAINGAEIIYRPSSLEPKISLGIWEVQNRARAIDNNCYVIAPNTGDHYIDDNKTVGFKTGGRSMIVDYRGQVLHMNYETGDAFVVAPINLYALRQHRITSKHLNWIPHIKSEIYRKIYERQIWPKNLAIQEAPKRREMMDEIVSKTVENLKKERIFESSDE